MKTNKYFKKLSLMLFVGMLLSVISCSKDSNIQESFADTDDAYVKIDVKGFVDSKDMTFSRSSLRGSSSKNSNKTSANDELVELNNVSFADVRMGTTTQLNKSNLLAQSSSSLSTNNDASTYSQMEIGTKYIVMVFDENDIHQSTTLVTLGSQDLIRIPKPENLSAGNTIKEYRFVAFTYNTKDEGCFSSILASLQPDQSGNQPKVKIPLDKQFLYCNVKYKMDFSASNLANQTADSISLIFYEQRSKVGVIIDGKSMFSKVKTVKGNFSGILTNTGTMDLKANTISDLTTDKSQSLEFSYSNLNQDTLAIYRYTVVATPSEKIDNYQVNLTALELFRDNVEKPLVTSASPRTFSFAPFLMSQGVQSVARVYLFEGFQVGTGANTKLWSLANLYYDPLVIDDYKFKIRANAYDGMAMSTDYFRFNRLNPISVDDRASSTAIGDPCSQLYPKGSWVLPTNSDINTFISSTEKYKMTVYDAKNDDVLGVRYDYIDYANNGKSIRFYTLGRRELGVYSFEGIRAEFWTSDDRVLRFLSLVTNGEAYASNAPSFGTGLALNVRCIRSKQT